jgi:hypothetical protein
VTGFADTFPLAAHLHELRQDPLLMLVALTCILGATILLLRRLAVVTLIYFAVAASAWVAVNGSVEGPTLFHVTRPHGVTVADLLPLFALALVVITRRSARRSGSSSKPMARS